MFFRLFLLFVVLPLVELAILLWLSTQIRPWYWTLVIVICTGIVGAALAKWQGIRAIGSVRRELMQGHMPTTSLLDGLLIVLAAALLATPGLITDCFGFSLLIPRCRTWYRGRLTTWLKKKFSLERFRGSPTAGGGDRILEAQVVESEAEPDEPS